MAIRTINGIALCAGIGGLENGLSVALGDAYRAVCLVEREAAAAAVLVARMQDGSLAPAAIWDDLTTFDGRPWRGVVDIVSGGIPCQSHSVAGKRAGTEDERWLWPEFRRIVNQTRPAFVFVENVPGMLTSPARHVRYEFAYQWIEGDLQRMGYEVASGIFSAAEVGAPHRRERLFILAYAIDRRSQIGWSVSNREVRDASNGGQRSAIEKSGILLADSPQRRQRELRESSGGNGQPDGSDADVGHSRRKPRSAEQRHEPRKGLRRRAQAANGSGAGKSSVALGNPAQFGFPVGRSERRDDGEEQSSADRTGESLGDTSSPRRNDAGQHGSGSSLQAARSGEQRGDVADLQSTEWRTGDERRGRGGERLNGARQAPSRLGEQGASILANFPPGPADFDAWRAILAERLDLAPAIESEIRGVADGTTERGMDLSRTDQLRALGNGVVALTAAKAFIVLARQLGMI